MIKVPVTVYIDKEVKDMLSKRQVPMSAWIRSAINRKTIYKRHQNTPHIKKYKIEYQRRKRRKNRDFDNAILRYCYQSVREACGISLNIQVWNKIRGVLRR